MTKNIEEEFDEAMRNVYRLVFSKCGYQPRRFLQLVNSDGGIAAAKQLLHSSRISDGLTELWDQKCLHLSMEALVLKEPWSQLFSDDDRRIARERLNALNYEQLS